MTTKIFDASAISVNIKEIRSIDLFEKCSSNYVLATSSEVLNEIQAGFSPNEIKKILERVQIHTATSSRYNLLFNYLADRFPYLHKGEISSFLVSLIEYFEKEKKFFFITDDKQMRKVIIKLEKDEFLNANLKIPFRNFSFSGCIGLIRKLKTINAITSAELEKIIRDLNTSSFYVSAYLLNYLRSG